MEVNFLTKKKTIVLAILIVGLFALSAVNAADNLTDDISSTDIEINEITSSDSFKSEDTANDNNVTDKPDILTIGENDNVSIDNKENVLSESSPSYTQYSLSVSDTTISAGSSGSVTISITPVSNSNYYAYDFYFRVYDSNGNQKISENLYSTTKSTSRTYNIQAGTLSAGTYTIKLINYADSHVMDTATLKVTSSSSSNYYPYYNDYSVSLSDYSITEGYSGSISMYVTPSTSSNYKYYYYFRVYDSNGNRVISKTYSSTSSTSSTTNTYSLSSSTLSSGTYTMKIENYYDGAVMDSATLKVNEVLRTNPYYSDYSVSLSDYTFTYGNSGYIYMTINPSTVSSYKYYYYFKIYDSNGNQKISQTYSSTSSSTSKSYSLSSYALDYGTYTMKIINYADNQVMDTATLKIVKSYPSYTDYSVSLSDYSITYGNGGTIYMTINPSAVSNYKYYYYFKIYDSNGNQKISQTYSSTSSSYSNTYSISSYDLSPGTYTMKIINDYDYGEMANATLTIKPKQTNSYDTTFSDLKSTINSASTYELIELNYDISNTDYSNSPISISKTLTIDGKGHSIDAKGLTRIFSISGTDVTLKNIKFKNAYYSSGSGGAIYWSGSNGKLINCTFENNKVDSSYNGGAVYWSSSYANITGCKFINNTAYNGGAVYLSSSYSNINNCDFTSNVASYQGGAVYSSSSTTISNSNFKNNNAEYGGAIAIGTSNTVNIIKSSFNNNVANYGSAIKWSSSLGTVTDCTFNGAKANSHKFMYISSKLYPYFYITAQDIAVGEKLNLTIDWSYDLQGNMSIGIFSERLNKTVYSTVKQLNGLSNSINILIPNLKASDYTLNVAYSGDNIYDERDIINEFTVIGKESTITFEVQDITWGTPIVLNPKVTSGATGLIDIYVNDEYIDTMNVGSKYTLTNVGGPSSIIELDYLGDDNYKSSYATKSVNVERLNIAAAIPDEIDSGYSTFTVTLNEDATGSASATVGSSSCYLVNSFNGTYTFTTNSKIAAGTRMITVNFEGDSKYNPQTFTKYVDVKIKIPTIGLNIPNVRSGNSVTFRPTIDYGATGSFEIYVDGSYKTSISVGNSYTLSSPSTGKHEVRVRYIGDSYYAACENATAFRAYVTDPIVAKNTQIIHNSGNYLKATFYDVYGNLLINKMIIFNVNGIDYYKRTNENGTAILDEKFDIGIYPVKITNIDVNHQKTVYLTIFTSIISQNLTVYYNSGYDFNATLLDEDATPLSNSIVLFNVSGTMYNEKTDGYGYVKLVVPLPVGTYTITTMNTKTNEIAVNKLVVVTSINSQDMSRAYNSGMDYKATFYDIDGSFLKNQTVTFEVDSKKYTVRTNNQGVAILNVGLDEGEYEITSINPVTNQRSVNKLIILERIINNEDVVVYGNAATYYRLRVIDNNAVVCGAGETVTFKLNGKTYNIKTDTTGYASLKITEPAGIYEVTATYYGYTVENKVTVLENVNSILTVTTSNINYGQNEVINISVNPNYLDGIVLINITGNDGYNKVFRLNAATSIIRELSSLNATNYNVKVEYIDFDNLIYSSAVKTFKVSKINPNIIVTVENAPFGENSTITVNVPQAEGNVTISVGGKTFNEYLVSDGVIVKRISDLRAGIYPVTATFNGNNNFNKASKTAQLNISKGSVGFYIDVKDIIYGSDVNVKVASTFDGKVTLKLGPTTKTVDVVANKEITVNFGKLNAGKYTVNANIIPKDNNYAEESDSMSFEVKKATPTITVKAENIDFNQKTKILVSISNSIAGNVNLKLNGKDYTQIISSSKAIFNISDIPIGKYQITASFAGNANFNSASATASFEVKKIQNFNLATPNAVSTYDNEFDLGLPDDAKGNVTLNINGENYVANVSNGKATLKLPQLSEGNYPYTIKYSGDDKYAGFSKTNMINIARTTIKSCDMTVNSGSGYDYKTTFINTIGAPLANTQVHIAVNGKLFAVKTDPNGVAVLNIGLGEGTYDITSINPLTGEQAKSTLKIIGGVTKTTLTAGIVRTVYNGGKYITLTLKDILGNPINSAILEVKIAGKIKYATTNPKGQAKLTTNGLNTGTYKTISAFAGNAKYSKVSVSSKVIVSKAKAKLTASKKTFKVSVKIKKYTVTLKTNKNKAMKKVKLTLKVKGKTYKAITNNKGKATFKITKLTKKGKFKAVVKFAGNRNYKSLSKKVVITVKA